MKKFNKINYSIRKINRCNNFYHKNYVLYTTLHTYSHSTTY